MCMVHICSHSLVVLVGTVASGKSEWARVRFSSWETVSPEKIRQELFGRSDNLENDTVVWNEIYRRVDSKLANGSRAVVDATNLKHSDREPFVHIAQMYGAQLVFVLFERSTERRQAVLLSRGLTRAYAETLISKQEQTLSASRKQLMRVPAEVINSNNVELVVGSPQLGSNLLAVGDVHGDFVRMQRVVAMAKAEQRQIVWLGDIVDYGPNNLKCVKLAYQTVASGQAVVIWGNHERKIGQWIKSNWGQNYRGRLSEANWATIREIESLNPQQRAKFLAAWKTLENNSQQCWRKDNWLFTHGAATPEMWHIINTHRLSNPDGEMAFFGQTDRKDPIRKDGYPNRIWDWVNLVPSAHNVVVGHDWVDRQDCRVVTKTNPDGGRVFCVDTGNSKGGRLAALAINTQDQTVEERYFDTDVDR